ncbi:MAG: cyclic nucleotide-binding domain-containing protein [Bacteroidota bacterium]
MDHANANQYVDNYFNSLRMLKVSEESIEVLRKHYKMIQVKSKQTIINPGEICKHAYLIVKGGFVCRYIHETSGVANTINFYLDDLHPVMACVDSYFNQRPTNCELRAIKDSVVIAIARSVLLSLIPKDIHFTKFYYEVITNAIF